MKPCLRLLSALTLPGVLEACVLQICSPESCVSDPEEMGNANSSPNDSDSDSSEEDVQHAAAPAPVPVPVVNGVAPLRSKSDSEVRNSYSNCTCSLATLSSSLYPTVRSACDSRVYIVDVACFIVSKA